jgi:hypothetical protein
MVTPTEHKKLHFPAHDISRNFIAAENRLPFTIYDSIEILGCAAQLS